MTVWPASFFFWGASGICRGYSRPLSIPPTSPREPEWSLFETPPKPLPQPTSARGPLPQMPQWHPRVAKRSSDRSSARGPCPQVLQRHPRVAKHLPSNLKSVSLFYPCRSSARGPFHRYLGGIPAWRRGLLSALWHGDPSHRHLRAIPAWRTASRPVQARQRTDALTGLRHGHPAHRCLSGILAEPL